MIHFLIDKRKGTESHMLITSFSLSPEDKLSPEEINRIGYETIKELTGGQYKFIVATMLIRTINQSYYYQLNQ